MPELPEVETIVRGLDSELRGKKVESLIFLSAHLKKERTYSTLDPVAYNGLKIEGIRRRGKLIIISFQLQKGLIIHLKMTGQLLLTEPDQPIDKHTHAIMRFSEIKKELRFRDIRKFGLISCLPMSKIEERILSSLGPEPLEIAFSDFNCRLKAHSKKRIKSWLLDQKIIAGIGNIYSDEILFQAGINPERPAGSLSLEETQKLFLAMKSVLRKAIKYKGSSISDYVDSSGQSGRFQRFHQVYGRENQLCKRCQKEKIRRKKIGGRSSFYCPFCQI